MPRRLYNNRRWRSRRERQLRREPLCRYCRQADRVTPATVADHVKPHGGDLRKFWRGDLQSLCETCHNAVKKAEETSGCVRGCHADGLPIDPRHHWHAPNRAPTRGEGGCN